MPHVAVSLLAGRTIAQKQKAAAAITEAIAVNFGCKPEDVGIVFTDVRAEDWAIGGKLLASERTES